MPNSKLTYRVTPPAAFVATSVGIVISATNSSGADIEFNKADEIQITFPDTIVANQNFTASTPEGSGYSAGKALAGNYFSVKAPFGFNLKPGDAMTITFSQVPIASDPDSGSNIGISESIGGGDPVLVSLPFEVKAAGLGIIAWLDKLVVGESQPATLNWQSSGGVQVVVSGFPTGTGQKTFPVQGEPPFLDSTIVYVPIQPQKPQQWFYTVTVYTGAGNHEQITVALQQNPPIINSYTSDPELKKIRVDASAVLSWHVQFASSVILTTPTIPNWRQPINANSYTANPGADLRKAYRFNFSQLPKTADYILTANGFSQPAVETITFTLEPVSLLYFKFSSKGGPNIIFKTDTANWNSPSKSSDPNLSTFTIYQPGGTADVYYLGSGDTVHPQIQFFDFTKKDGKFQLEWVTANLKTLVLNPNGIAITESQIANGTMEVEAAGVYTLTGTTAAGLSVNSVLEVSA